MTGRAAPGGWFQPADADPDAALRLFAIPHAGGGAALYREWQQLLPADIALQAVQLPGRQDRAALPAHTEIEPLVDGLCEAVADELDGRPYALFGHSLGALLAYRVAVGMAAAGGAVPALVAAAGWAPVGFAMPTRDKVDLPDAALLDWLCSIGSAPPDSYADPEVLALTMPPTRADLTVCVNYVDDAAAVPCPVVTYTGRSDPLMAPSAVASWIPRCPSYLGNCEFPGDHFFVQHHAMAITIDLTRHFRRCAARATADVNNQHAHN